VSESPETLHARGRAALLAGEERLDVPPSSSGTRWGLSIVLSPDEALARRLAAETDALADLAGPGQWRTGGAGSCHVTVRTLEAYRAPVAADDERTAGYVAVLRRAAARSGPVRLQMRGLILTPGGVLAGAVPLDGAADRLRQAVLHELAEDDFERGYRGRVWWASLVHFAAPVARRRELLDRVEACRQTDFGVLVASRIDLVRYQYKCTAHGGRTAPVTLMSAALLGREDGGGP